MLLVAGSLFLPAVTAWKFQSFHSSNFTPPELYINKSGAALGEGYLILTPKQFTQDEAPIMVSDTGDLIWNGPEGSSTNLFVQYLHGHPVLSWWSGTGSNIGRGYGQVNILNQQYEQIYTIYPKLNLTTSTGTSSGCGIDLHESLITDNGTIICTAANVTRADLSSIGGPSDGWVYDTMFLEIDIATNEILFLWSPLQAGIAINSTKATFGLVNGFGTSQSSPFDWFHTNSVSKLANGGYLANSRHTWSTYGLDSTGSVEWTLQGSTGGDFGPLPSGATFSWQHHTRTQNETDTSLILHMFNDQNASPFTSNPSNGLLLELDLSAKTVQLLQKLEDPNDEIVSSSQGAYHALANDNVILGYGDVATVKEFGPAGDVRMSVEFGGLATQSFRAYRCEWSGTPSEYPPSVAGSYFRSKGWASWNGDTATTVWRVYAGSSSTSLAHVGDIGRTGFETEFTIPTGAEVVQVSAYAGGTFLMNSSVVTVDLL